MNGISLSIIVPVYNTEKYLKKCIDSIIKAIEVLNKRVEIIVINDGSKGNTDEIIQSYSDISFIRYIKQENRGRGATRNLGIREAKGRYITFVDSDDYINENMYYDMFLEIDANDRDLVICDVESVDESENNLLLIPGRNSLIEDVRLSCFDVMMVASSVNKIFKKELFDGIKFPEDINYEDLATIPVVYLKSKNIGYINKVYYYYLQNSNSIMNQEYGVEKLNIIKALQIAFENIDKLNILEDEKEKAKYMLFTRRYYEEILEKIILSENKDELIDSFLVLSKMVIEVMKNNSYLLKDFKTQGFIKNYYNQKMFEYILSGNKNKIKKLLRKKRYYRKIAIIYSSNGIK
ncbi:MAG: glycosyltransferase family 2 protein [Clostridia bacterium]|nr:glycosyltransferase family 2 protein [Clostridia bacterium]